ncbi:MAG: ribonuclease E/G, partial [Alphaproteobacteria bacterium]|nr:ribonuclease E/G [Alphaproteobacteria bacterium]
MAQRMLIDATHPEETRVAVVSGNRLEDIDYETSTKQQLKGNIYLAKVVRVEPSLQACFVDYGGNRHGFLAFSEIHPDYYRIPVSDREALLAEQAAAARAEEEEEDRRDREGGRRGRGPRSDDDGQGDDGQGDDGQGDDDSQGEGGPESLATPIEVTEVGGFEPATIDASPDATATRAPAEPEPAPPSAPGESTPAWTPTEWAIATRAPADEAAGEPAAGSAALRMTMPETSAEAIWPADESAPAAGARAQGETAQPAAGEGAPGEAPVAGDLEARQADEPAALQEARTAGRVETVGGDAADEVPRRPRRQFRSYKIQEVIKRRQIMLVQVVKEERGNKGAALTTYLSLAGRYCVLMPNTTRGGGVSRKITSAQDRRRLKTLLEDLELPQGMAVIVRTAGSERSKAEVKRDCDYLLRLW